MESRLDRAPVLDCRGYIMPKSDHGSLGRPTQRMLALAAVSFFQAFDLSRRNSSSLLWLWEAGSLPSGCCLPILW